MPGPTAASPSALAAVQQALPGWISSLLDFSGRNQLLYCKTSGKIDFALADKEALHRLCSGTPVKLSALFPEDEAFAEVAKVAKRVRERMRTFDEEMGVRVGRVVSGFASWQEQENAGSAYIIASISPCLSAPNMRT